MKNYKRFYKGLKALYSMIDMIEDLNTEGLEENLEAERVLEWHLHRSSLRYRVRFVRDINEDSQECIHYYTLDGVPVLFVGYQDPISTHSGYFYGFTKILGNDSLKHLVKSCF